MDINACTRFRECYQETANSQLLDILRRNADIPLSIERLAGMLSKTPAQIVDAVEELEGPVASDPPGAFVYFWRFTGEAVYMPR